MERIYVGEIRKTPMSHKIHTDYLRRALDPAQYKRSIKNLCDAIKLHAPNAEAVAFRGASGALVGMAVCARLKLPPILVRKPKEGSHSCMKAEGAIGATNIVIVDDLISSGATVQAILDGIMEQRKASWTKVDGKIKCLGVFLYVCTARDRVWWNSQKVDAYGCRGDY